MSRQAPVPDDVELCWFGVREVVELVVTLCLASTAPCHAQPNDDNGIGSASGVGLPSVRADEPLKLRQPRQRFEVRILRNLFLLVRTLFE